MFRSAVVSLVFIIGLVPSFGPVCKVVCGLPTATASHCADRADTGQVPAVDGNGACDPGMPSPATFATDGVRRTVAVGHPEAALVQPAAGFSVPSLRSDLSVRPWAPSSHINTTLRI